MTGTLIAEVIPSLGWLDAIPASPVRLMKLRNHASVDAEFQGVPFETYIVLENIYFQNKLSNSRTSESAPKSVPSRSLTYRVTGFAIGIKK